MVWQSLSGKRLASRLAVHLASKMKYNWIWPWVSSALLRRMCSALQASLAVFAEHLGLLEGMLAAAPGLEPAILPCAVVKTDIGCRKRAWNAASLAMRGLGWRLSCGESDLN